MPPRLWFGNVRAAVGRATPPGPTTVEVPPLRWLQMFN